MASFKTSAAAQLVSRAAGTVGTFQTPTVLRTQTELLPLFFMAEMVAEARLACITLGTPNVHIPRPVCRPPQTGLVLCRPVYLSNLR